MTIVKKVLEDYVYVRPFNPITFSKKRIRITGKNGEAQEYQATMNSSENINFGEYILHENKIYKASSMGASYAGIFRYALEEHEIYSGSLVTPSNLESSLEAKVYG